MPYQLAQIKEDLLPGLAHAYGRLYRIRWNQTSWVPGDRLAAPHIWIPKLTLPEAIAAGAAAAVIQNPVVTRRFWKGWLA
jgi:hypothetical protein